MTHTLLWGSEPMLWSTSLLPLLLKMMEVWEGPVASRIHVRGSVCGCVCHATNLCGSGCNASNVCEYAAQVSSYLCYQRFGREPKYILQDYQARRHAMLWFVSSSTFVWPSKNNLVLLLYACRPEEWDHKITPHATSASSQATCDILCASCWRTASGQRFSHPRTWKWTSAQCTYECVGMFKLLQS